MSQETTLGSPLEILEIVGPEIQGRVDGPFPADYTVGGGATLRKRMARVQRQNELRPSSREQGVEGAADVAHPRVCRQRVEQPCRAAASAAVQQHVWSRSLFVPASHAKHDLPGREAEKGKAVE